jgi:C1A family cysteine protease
LLSVEHSSLVMSVCTLAAVCALTVSVAGSSEVRGAAADEAPSQMPPASVDLRPALEKWGLSTRRQGSRGTCSVFAVTGALEYAVATQQQHGTRLSVEFLNWAAHTAVKRTQDGGFFSELWKGYELFGICPEDDQPYQRHFDAGLQPDPAAMEHAKSAQTLGLKVHWIKEWDVHTGLTTAQLAGIKATIAKSWPVCGGFRWPKKAVWKESILQLCSPEDVFDGHSVLLVGYRDDPQQPGGGVFLVRNSGGDGSDGFLPYAYATAYMNDAVWIGTSKR